MNLPPFAAKHYMPQHWELILGFAVFIIGCWLIWSGTDNRGHSLPWPVSGLMPM